MATLYAYVKGSNTFFTDVKPDDKEFDELTEKTKIPPKKFFVKVETETENISEAIVKIGSLLQDYASEKIGGTNFINACTDNEIRASVAAHINTYLYAYVSEGKIVIRDTPPDKSVNDFVRHKVVGDNIPTVVNTILQDLAKKNQHATMPGNVKNECEITHAIKEAVETHLASSRLYAYVKENEIVITDSMPPKEHNAEAVMVEGYDTPAAIKKLTKLLEEKNGNIALSGKELVSECSKDDNKDVQEYIKSSHNEIKLRLQRTLAKLSNSSRLLHEKEKEKEKAVGSLTSEEAAEIQRSGVKNKLGLAQQAPDLASKAKYVSKALPPGIAGEALSASGEIFGVLATDLATVSEIVDFYLDPEKKDPEKIMVLGLKVSANTLKTTAGTLKAGSEAIKMGVKFAGKHTKSATAAAHAGATFAHIADPMLAAGSFMTSSIGLYLAAKEFNKELDSDDCYKKQIDLVENYINYLNKGADLLLNGKTDESKDIASAKGLYALQPDKKEDIEGLLFGVAEPKAINEDLLKKTSEDASKTLDEQRLNLAELSLSDLAIYRGSLDHLSKNYRSHIINIEAAVFTKIEDYLKDVDPKNQAEIRDRLIGYVNHITNLSTMTRVQRKLTESKNIDVVVKVLAGTGLAIAGASAATALTFTTLASAGVTAPLAVTVGTTGALGVAGAYNDLAKKMSKFALEKKSNQVELSLLALQKLPKHLAQKEKSIYVDAECLSHTAVSIVRMSQALRESYPEPDSLAKNAEESERENYELILALHEKSIGDELLNTQAEMQDRLSKFKEVMASPFIDYATKEKVSEKMHLAQKSYSELLEYYSQQIAFFSQPNETRSLAAYTALLENLERRSNYTKAYDDVCDELIQAKRKSIQYDHKSDEKYQLIIERISKLENILSEINDDSYNIGIVDQEDYLKQLQDLKEKFIVLYTHSGGQPDEKDSLVLTMQKLIDNSSEALSGTIKHVEEERLNALKVLARANEMVVAEDVSYEDLFKAFQERHNRLKDNEEDIPQSTFADCLGSIAPVEFKVEDKSAWQEMEQRISALHKGSASEIAANSGFSEVQKGLAKDSSASSLVQARSQKSAEKLLQEDKEKFTAVQLETLKQQALMSQIVADVYNSIEEKFKVGVRLQHMEILNATKVRMQDLQTLALGIENNRLRKFEPEKEMFVHIKEQKIKELDKIDTEFEKILKEIIEKPDEFIEGKKDRPLEIINRRVSELAQSLPAQELGTIPKTESVRDTSSNTEAEAGLQQTPVPAGLRTQRDALLEPLLHELDRDGEEGNLATMKEAIKLKFPKADSMIGWVLKNKNDLVHECINGSKAENRVALLNELQLLASNTEKGINYTLLKDHLDKEYKGLGKEDGPEANP